MRFRCSTEGDVGMNIVSEGVKHVLDYLLNNFNDMEPISTSSLVLFPYLGLSRSQAIT